MPRSVAKYLTFRPRRDFVIDVPGSSTQPRQLLAAGTQAVVRNEVLRHQLRTSWREEVEIIAEQRAVEVRPLRSLRSARGKSILLLLPSEGLGDCILYAGQARYTVQADDATLEDLAARLPASSSSDYGTPFYEIFERYERDFYKIDKLLFSPAEVWLTSATSGRTFHGGRVDPAVLRASLYG